MNKFVRTKNHTASKFSKTSLGFFMHVSDCSCAPILQVFSAASDGATANRQIPECIFWPFFTSLMKNSITKYGSILTHFQPSVRGLDVLYNALNVSYFFL